MCMNLCKSMLCVTAQIYNIYVYPVFWRRMLQRINVPCNGEREPLEYRAVYAFVCLYGCMVLQIFKNTHLREKLTTHPFPLWSKSQPKPIIIRIEPCSDRSWLVIWYFMHTKNTHETIHTCCWCIWEQSAFLAQRNDAFVCFSIFDLCASCVDHERIGKCMCVWFCYQFSS